MRDETVIAAVAKICDMLVAEHKSWLDDAYIDAYGW